MSYTSEAYSQRLVINVSGQRFETVYKTVSRFPNTRLALLAARRERDENYDAIRDEYFFDRHPGIFADVLHYYRTEELHLNQNICGNSFKKEFDYWGLYEQDIEPCCWTIYTRASECKETLAALDFNFLSKPDSETSKEDEIQLTKWQKFRIKSWDVLDDPSSSNLSRIYAVISVIFLIISILTFVLASWEGLRIVRPTTTYLFKNCTSACGIYFDPAVVYRPDPDTTDPHPALIYTDIATFIFFLLELLARLICTPSYRVFFKDLLNWIDIICVVTQFTSILIEHLDTENSSGYTATMVRTVLTLRVIRGIRIVRVLRMFKLVKHYNAFRILVYTIRVSVRELVLMIVFLLVGAVIFGSLMHMIDRENYRNIPLGLWWALVTMTTVGYGDFVPRNEFGYVVGSVCVIFGVLTIAFTVPIVVNNFQLYYQHAMARNKRPKSYWNKRRTPRFPVPEPQIQKITPYVPSKSDELNNLNVNDTGKKGPIYQNKPTEFSSPTRTNESVDCNLVSIETDVPQAYEPASSQLKTFHPAASTYINVRTPGNLENGVLNNQFQIEEHSRQLLAGMFYSDEQREAERQRQLLDSHRRQLEAVQQKKKAMQRDSQLSQDGEETVDGTQENSSADTIDSCRKQITTPKNKTKKKKKKKDNA